MYPLAVLRTTFDKRLKQMQDVAQLHKNIIRDNMRLRPLFQRANVASFRYACNFLTAFHKFKHEGNMRPLLHGLPHGREVMTQNFDRNQHSDSLTVMLVVHSP